MIYDFCKSYMLPLLLGLIFLPVSIAATLFNIAISFPRAFTIITIVAATFLIGKNAAEVRAAKANTGHEIKLKHVLSVTSPSFIHKTNIPKKFTCEGENVNPALTIGNIPSNAKSLVLIMDDPDATMGTFDHWVVWNIPPTGQIAENSVPGSLGKNGKSLNAYTGPCPPTGTHRYFFKVYALDDVLRLEEGATKNVVERAMRKHIIASGELVGLYKKQKKSPR